MYLQYSIFIHPAKNERRSIHAQGEGPTVANQLQVDRLRDLATDIRRRDLEMVHRARLGHIGGDLSATDILTALYFAVLKVDPAAPAWPERDRFILSKGHCAGALYATLAEAGFIQLDELRTYMQPQSRLGGHPDRTKMPASKPIPGRSGMAYPWRLVARWRPRSMVPPGARLS